MVDYCFFRRRFEEDSLFGLCSLEEEVIDSNLLHQPTPPSSPRKLTPGALKRKRRTVYTAGMFSSNYHCTIRVYKVQPYNII